MSVIVKFLGTAQDGGIPQMECNCEICTDIRAGKRKEILQAAIGIENAKTGNRYMIEATPAFSKQYQSFIADKVRWNIFNTCTYGTLYRIDVFRKRSP